MEYDFWHYILQHIVRTSPSVCFSVCFLPTITVVIGDCQSPSEMSLLIPFEGGPCRENVWQELVKCSLSFPGGEK